MKKKLLEMRNITKDFSGVKALDHVNLVVQEGEIHALVGENGAGKSTLMNILSGIYAYGTYEGDIIYDGKICEFHDIKESTKVGIVIIHQELALIPYLTIAENVYLGNECSHHGLINWDETYRRTEQLMKRVGLHENSETAIKDIGVGKQQLVEIVKALSKNARLLILDEPTAALNDDDAEHLLDLLLELKQEGLTAIIITHKLNEVMKVADKITVLRDGSTIETIDPAKETVTPDRIVAGMVGRSLKDYYPKRTPHIGEVMFEIRDWTAYAPNVADKKIVDNVNLTVRRGEIVGIAGLMGAGRTELAMSVFGRSYGTKISGHLHKDGKELNLKTVSDAIRAGIAYVTEDRKQAGLILTDDVLHNISLASLNKISKHGVVDTNAEISAAQDYTKRMNIKVSSISQLTGKLSGGNQQKVVLSKWIMTDPDLLILDEPTRGIDVGAKYEIYCIINDLIAQGKSVLMISSEMPELLGMADRIYVMNEGRIVGQMDAAEATQNKIMNCILQAKETA